MTARCSRDETVQFISTSRLPTLHALHTFAPAASPMSSHVSILSEKARFNSSSGSRVFSFSQHTCGWMRQLCVGDLGVERRVSSLVSRFFPLDSYDAFIDQSSVAVPLPRTVAIECSPPHPDFIVAILGYAFEKVARDLGKEFVVPKLDLPLFALACRSGDGSPDSDRFDPLIQLALVSKPTLDIYNMMGLADAHLYFFGATVVGLTVSLRVFALSKSTDGSFAEYHHNCFMRGDVPSRSSTRGQSRPDAHSDGFSEDFDGETEECLKLLREAPNIVVVSGAGVSVAAGLPTFRGDNSFRRSDWEYPANFSSNAFLVQVQYSNPAAATQLDGPQLLLIVRKKGKRTGLEAAQKDLENPLRVKWNPIHLGDLNFMTGRLKLLAPMVAISEDAMEKRTELLKLGVLEVVLRVVEGVRDLLEDDEDEEGDLL
ncbi:uncharacterized protein EV422DRAFT_102157 [Fimicolochytrium jonesii]|uniref:uncharacterized protein n=1 Tax=Fimicolochytrium jonesii TaxID=1396493 RepID=UPI0022FEC57C|nr:uncharacterized protein EV422DRAFT_102157 [Fimicolochytrium jonesii]KAI8819673.1 hypothetical protein EV422DRAFT_102157 [Fimicolochytrium jonesii]